MVPSIYSETLRVTGLTTGATFWILPQLLPLELLNRYKNGWEVMGACNANGTMSQRSDQLLLTPENDHFEGSMLSEGEGRYN